MKSVWARAALLAGGTIALTQTSMDARSETASGGTPAAQAATEAGAEGIRPFRVHYPDEALADLKRRIAATRWPEREIVTDQSQGVPLATMQKLARYWSTEYDWRKCEARLNALPQFVTRIDGLDIHFIHVRSKHPNALPMAVPSASHPALVKGMTMERAVS